MKKWICFMMTTILCAMTLTACGNADRQQESVNVQEQEDAVDQEQIPEAESQEDGTGSEAEAQEDVAESEAEEQQEASGSTEEQAGKILVAYYSASGNTKAVGDMIAQYTGGDVFEIIPVNAYTSEDLDWTEEGSRVNQEHEDESLQDIELVSATVDNFDSYDTVFIGFAGGIIGLNQEKPINQGFALV